MTAAERLKSLADRILKLMADRDAIGGDIKDVFTEVKSAGFNAPALRKVIAAMRMDTAKREALEFDIDAYRLAVGLDRVQADKMLSEGKGIRETNRATGVPLATLHRRSKTLAKTENGTDRASNARRAPEGPAARVTQPSPAPITESPAGASPQCATDCDPVAAPLPSSSAVPAGDPDEGWQAKDSAGNHAHAIGAMRARIVERGEERLISTADFDPARDMPSYLRRAPAGEGA